MKSNFKLLTNPSPVATMVFCFAVLASCAAIADCSEEEFTAVFILQNIYINPTVPVGPENLEGVFQRGAGEPDRVGLANIDLSRDIESFWQPDTFNCANLDSTTLDNHAWWCGTQFEKCHPDDPSEGFGNGWNQWLDWHATVPDPSEPVTVTVRARINLDIEVVYDFFKLQYIGQEGEFNVWQLDGFAEGLSIEQTFSIQHEDYSDLLNTVHLRWCYQSDGALSDEDCRYPSSGGVQIDLIEVFFDQGAGPVQMGNTETCEPGSELQWNPEVLELELTLLDVAPVGPVTNPSIAEMIEAVEAIQPYNYYQHQAQVGPFHLIFQEPNDFGGSAIVDGRDGRVIFAGTTVWLGDGSITMPVESSHSWSFTPDEPAAEPATVGILPNVFWLAQYTPANEITDAAMNYLRQSDVLRSFSDCGPYDVVSYIYTPGVHPGVDPDLASLIVIVSGLCGSPWSDLASTVPQALSDELSIGVFPNPFNPRTSVTFSINSQQTVKISVYDLSGKRIAVLADGLFQTGTHSLDWGGKDLQGNAVASGSYFVQMATQNGVTTQKMMLIK